MIKPRLFQFAAAACLALFAGTSLAQWSADPLVSTPVADGDADQGVPLARATSDGGVWISLMDNGPGNGYKPRAQRLSAGGVRMFPGNGPILANRTNTATFVYDMKVDALDNCIVAFDDNSSGTTVVTVQKVAPDGSLPWGPTGIQMPATNNVLAPRVAVCADGTYVVAWAISTSVFFQRVNPNASLGTAWSVFEASRYHAMSDLQAGATGGDVIALWVRGETTNAQTSRKGLQMQKFDSTDAAVWNAGAAVEIYTSQQTPLKSIQNGYFPALVPDGSGGGIVAWYDNGLARNAWLQHVESSGNSRFAPQGLALSNIASGELRLSATVAYHAAANAYTVAYQRSNTGQSQFGLSAQRVDSDGVLHWGGGSGAVVVPMGSFQSSFINVNAGSCGAAYLTWMQYTSALNLEIQAAALDLNGLTTWTPNILPVGIRATPKGRLSVARSSTGPMLIGAWIDGSAGAGDILAQNINFGGSLGTPPCPADFDADGTVDFFDYDAFVICFEGGACPPGK
ncbi:MAG: hypothetical protein AABZ53_15275, partial [Planctomycetota bacterium]